MDIRNMGLTCSLIEVTIWRTQQLTLGESKGLILWYLSVKIPGAACRAAAGLATVLRYL